MRSASIDLGTHTCLLLIKEDHPSGEKILYDESTVVRLGQGVDQTGMLQMDAMKRAQVCLHRYVETTQKFGIPSGKIIAVATAQARDAKNAAQFFGLVEKDLGVHFRVLTGVEEAKATFLGAQGFGDDSKNNVVMDIGGGSTELVAMPDGDQNISGESLNIGAVRMTERYFKSDPVTDEEFWECEDAINQMLEPLKTWRKNLEKKMNSAPTLIAVAGTAVTLAMMHTAEAGYDPIKINQVVLTQGDAHRLVEELKWRTIPERQKMLGMEPKRADVILAGALIFWRVMEELSFQEAKISTRGLRYGVFYL